MPRNAIAWGDFRFPGLNLWNAPPSPEMLSLYREMAEGKGMRASQAEAYRAEAKHRLVRAEETRQLDRFRLLLAHH